ncbi:uncharacterized protein LOC106768848 [Vigna radiata var. radiata]|uniref:Uncharacterized protein LOC106768848 n=1 Tax=Vigna radiata var. radiata TaxID=3916 RepID=A0A1S3UUE3_VIGRR|nr:uncharacterized protein LOC106768848 [Vigna radiata var. radiata]
MDTEEFSFPRISDTCSHNIDSPPLWNLSPAASPNPYHGNTRRENDCFGAAKLVAEVHRKSFSCVENRRKRNGFEDEEEEEEEEEKMDLLWEDFNEELYSTTTTTGSATSSSREVVEFRSAHELTLAKTTQNSLLHPTKNKPAMVVIVKIFKKLFSIHNSHGRSRKAVR